MANFEIAGLSVAPGELKFTRHPIAQLRDGTMVTIPVMVMHGAQEGPKLWLDAAYHGEEIPGMEVIRRIMREEVDPSKLRGSIVAVPVHNPMAFNAGMGYTPYYPGGRPVAPGNPKGSLDDRIAYRTFGLASQCDYVIHFHSNHYPAVEFAPVTMCENRQILDASIELAEVFGVPLSEARKAEGWFTLACQRAGKPATVIELLAHGYLDKRSVGLGVLGTLNVLRHLKMIEGEVQPLPDLKVPPGRYGRGFIYCNKGGLAHFRKEAGDWVERGEVIAIIRDVFGDVVDEVPAPVQGYIRTGLFGAHNEAVFEGGLIASVLDADPARRYFFD